MARISTHLWVASFLVILATLFVTAIMYSVSPLSAKTWQFAVFYFFIFLWIFGVVTLLGYAIRLIFWRAGLKYEFLKSARRQALLLGVLTVISLMLKSADILNLKVGALLFAIFVLIEFYVQ